MELISVGSGNCVPSEGIRLPHHRCSYKSIRSTVLVVLRSLHFDPHLRHKLTLFSKSRTQCSVRFARAHQKQTLQCGRKCSGSTRTSNRYCILFLRVWPKMYGMVRRWLERVSRKTEDFTRHKGVFSLNLFREHLNSNDGFIFDCIELLSQMLHREEVINIHDVIPGHHSSTIDGRGSNPSNLRFEERPIYERVYWTLSI